LYLDIILSRGEENDSLKDLLLPNSLPPKQMPNENYSSGAIFMKLNIELIQYS
jgi:hypothetical protein